MTTIVSLPLATYPAGTVAIPEVPISDAFTRFSASCQRNTAADTSIWPSAATTISVVLDFFDGTVWTVGIFFWSDAGGLRQKNGVDVAQSFASWPIPPGTGRRLRGSVTVAGGAIRTSAVVDGV